ncbi:hypothetical protein AMAG_03141 [Allomyces macrogynus ATCC 38327]|uniref:Uncharacterized protein n=1 Tax=Allomyces macrogynus (strain ATCC 38327) TaxID=578462 RepID=A0A0L0S4E6_ALLM3|nr:hypothetical protein AMAG_03141 [Allomyces macrogynus ATCC 38327]|eukprot:KNE57423.1 hypothetical protein AMAG_03141 [Allomyces macrogynus ATCC 38327]
MTYLTDANAKLLHVTALAIHGIHSTGIPGILNMPKCRTLVLEGKLVFLNHEMRRRFMEHLPQNEDLSVMEGPAVLAGTGGYRPKEIAITTLVANEFPPNLRTLSVPLPFFEQLLPTLSEGLNATASAPAVTELTLLACLLTDFILEQLAALPHLAHLSAPVQSSLGDTPVRVLHTTSHSTDIVFPSLKKIETTPAFFDLDHNATFSELEKIAIRVVPDHLIAMRLGVPHTPKLLGITLKICNAPWVSPTFGRTVIHHDAHEVDETIRTRAPLLKTVKSRMPKHMAKIARVLSVLLV